VLSTYEDREGLDVTQVRGVIFLPSTKLCAQPTHEGFMFMQRACVWMKGKDNEELLKARFALDVT
jgi:hypothetical protein